MDDGTIVTLRSADGSEAAVSLHGGHLLSWRPAGEREQIYTSPTTQPTAGKALRGGAPICFPQFAQRGPLAKHGFARTSRWELVTGPSVGSVSEATFQLDSTMVASGWEHPFCLVLVVKLGPAWLELHLQAANTGRQAFEFTGAIHTYFAVDDVRDANVRGLKGLRYEDSAGGGVVKEDAASEVRFDGEVDRIYLGAPAEVDLVGGGMPRRRIVQEGFGDTVVWNPGPMKATALGDMPAADWTRMVCVEAGVVGSPVTLAPGKTWRGMQRVELGPIS
ncbi:D-hexose-6-phosphate mutarotase [Ramlibacter sp. PS3R-8]|uniref:D-hexose-6-phosphate mutarotase n=1 Tax=Ramlibacter sp. PS3R-8 TaxID=3133437 RepID=UPI0030B5ABB5